MPTVRAAASLAPGSGLGGARTAFQDPGAPGAPGRSRVERGESRMAKQTCSKRQKGARRADVRRAELRGAIGRPRRARARDGGGEAGGAKATTRDPAARRGAWLARHVPKDMLYPHRPARGVVVDVSKDRQRGERAEDACLEGQVYSADERPRGLRARTRQGACERVRRRAGVARRGPAAVAGLRAAREADRSGPGARQREVRRRRPRAGAGLRAGAGDRRAGVGVARPRRSRRAARRG